MNKKIKVIDLLNIIANEEEIPRHIKYKYYQYDWSDNSNDYICEDADGERLSMFDDGYICILCNSLNNEVEILEDNTEEIDELSYEWTTNEIADRVDKLIKAVNEIRKDLNKWMIMK